ncbi:MAG: Lrp/AsnC family transcriptional regulator, leucine-responsive regulatory protein [Alphaproteobacteria bacterium]|jgi:Lrp/AsnC family leucine-responsive transcriptional regulator|nr:Lrp/AsnC family transcriptional regulator, leucine-responsive regulatory protein [Alphaproteobacteria bacterium]
MDKSTQLTAPDLTLIRLLQTDATLTIEALARAANLSASAAQRRVQRLRDQKVILGDVAIVDPRKVGRALTLLVELELERDRPELLPALKTWIAETPAVQQAWYVTGRGDLVLVITATSIEDFDALMEQLMEQNRNVRKFTTSVALKTLKRGLVVPVGRTA